MLVAELHDIFLKSSGVCTDTRSLEEGNIFFALKGGNFNGNKYALSALENGASFAVVDENLTDDKRLVVVDDVLSTLQELASYHRKQLKCPVLAIVGSNGKTTTKELTAAVLQKKYKLCFTKGNLNNHIGVPLTILSANLDAEFLLIEMGANHQKEIDFLCNIADPDFGVLINIGLAHLEGFGGVEGVKIGKTELYWFLNKKNKTIFFNKDEVSILEFRDQLNNVFEFGEGTDIQVVKDDTSTELLDLRLTIDGEVLDVQSQLFGDYNLNNILTAAAIGHYFGVDPAKIKLAVQEYSPSNNRSQLKITEKGNHVIMDAYNANPTSMCNAIKEFSSLYKNAYYLLGDMLELGEESHKEHRKVLNSLEGKLANVYLVGKEFGYHRLEYQDQKTFRFFADVQLLSQELQRTDIKNSKVLVKGSRGVALEKTIPHL